MTNRVLSSYRRTDAPKPFNDGPAIVFMNDDDTTFWKMGAAGWLRKLGETERYNAATRLICGSTTCHLLDLASQEEMWTAGRHPAGVAIGLAGLTVRLPGRRSYSRYGWLSQDGAWFPCGECEHVRLAMALADREERDLERDGWAKISGHRLVGSVIGGLSDEQIAFLEANEIYGGLER